MFNNVGEVDIDSKKNVIVQAIKDLIRDNQYVSEIETNGPGLLFYKERGKRKSIPLPLKTEGEYAQAIDGLIENAGFIKSRYLVEGRYALPGGRFGRLHIAMPPATPNPLVTLAIKTAYLNDLTSIQSSGSFNTEISLFLRAAIASKLTIVLSGGTGVGKALHKDTKIPSPEGMKTVGELNEGDIIFDENGNETKILKKYSPNDPKSYEITFKSGQKVKTSAGHLWNVINLNKKETIGPTRRTIISDEEIDSLENKLKYTSNDEYISRSEICKIINNEKSLVGIITNRLEKHHGGNIVKFNNEELLFLQDKIRALSTVDFKDVHELSWREFEKLSDRRINSQYVREILKTKKYNTKEAYYKKKDALQAIIDECRSRTTWHKNREKHVSKKDIRPRLLMSTEDMFKEGVKNKKERLNFAIEYLSKEVDYKEKELKIDPYTLGAWLGDGISDRAVICGADTEIHQKVLESYDLKKENKFLNKKETMYLYDWRYEGLVDDLKYYNLLRNKHIPSIYMTSSRQQRIELIAGLVDTDGSVTKSGVITFGNTIKSIVEDARKIVMSLGWSASPITSRIGKYKHEETGEIVECKEIYTFRFIENGLNLEIPRKQERIDKRSEKETSQQSRHSRHYITDIKEINDNPEDYFCFQVDSPSHLFLCTEEFIPTHNTTLLEALTNEFHIDERVGVCEDTPELELKNPNTPYLNSTVRVPGMAPEDVADLSWIVQQINRMRVDRIIIGETRGREFFDFVVAANSGKPGSLTTIHANNGPAAMKKMSTFMYMAVDMAPRIINEMIAEAVDVVIQLGRNEKTGEHKILSIHEVTDAISSGESPTIALNPLFLYDHDTDTWTRKYATDPLKQKFTNHGYDANNYTLAKNENNFEEHSSGGLPSYFKK